MVVLEGEIEILSDGDTLVTVHRPGNFSGDVDVIAGHPAACQAKRERWARARTPRNASNVVCSRNSEVPASGKDESQNSADRNENHPTQSLSEGVLGSLPPAKTRGWDVPTDA